MTDDTYNGWTNKATWLVKLWIDNDQGEQEYWLDSARVMLDSVRFQKANDSNVAHTLADTLKEHFEEGADEYQLGRSPIASHLISGNSFFSDLMSWALAMVNWDEVAKSLIEDAAEIPA